MAFLATGDKERTTAPTLKKQRRDAPLRRAFDGGKAGYGMYDKGALRALFGGEQLRRRFAIGVAERVDGSFANLERTRRRHDVDHPFDG